MPTQSVLVPAIKDLTDAASDLRRTPIQNVTNVLVRLVQALDDEPLVSFLTAALPKVDFEAWWAEMRATGGSIVGSRSLAWPVDRSERVAIQLQLCRALADGAIDFLEFALHHCYAGTTNLNAQVPHFADLVLTPLVRDIGRLAERRVIPSFLRNSIDGLPKSGDSILDSMLRDVCVAFDDPSPTSRRVAVERLWDVWERLKSLDKDGNKKLSLEHQLALASHDAAFRALLEADARELTDIGNEFHIRHFERDRNEVKQLEHYDYLFYRLFALVQLLLTTRSRGPAL